MKNCLVTKLKRSVNNDNLEPLGGMYVWFDHVESPTAESQWLRILSAANQTLVAVEGYFTDSTLTQNLGSSKEIIADGDSQIYVSNGAKILIPNKYGIKILDLQNNGQDASLMKNKRYNVENLAYCSSPYQVGNINGTAVFGDLSKVKWLGSTNPSYVYLQNSEVHGDISNCEWIKNTDYLWIFNTDIALDINKLADSVNPNGIFNFRAANSKLYGSLPEGGIVIQHSAVIDLSGTLVTGDVKNLPVGDTIYSLNLSNCEGLHGDIEDYARSLIAHGWDRTGENPSYTGINKTPQDTQIYGGTTTNNSWIYCAIVKDETQPEGFRIDYAYY